MATAREVQLWTVHLQSPLQLRMSSPYAGHAKADPHLRDELDVRRLFLRSWLACCGYCIQTALGHHCCNMGCMGHRYVRSGELRVVVENMVCKRIGFFSSMFGYPFEWIGRQSSDDAANWKGRWNSITPVGLRLKSPGTIYTVEGLRRRVWIGLLAHQAVQREHESR